MTISNSRTLIKLSQIDCERRFNLNWLRKHYEHNEHFYSHRIQQRKIESFIYLSSTSHVLASAALILIFNDRYFLLQN